MDGYRFSEFTSFISNISLVKRSFWRIQTIIKVASVIGLGFFLKIRNRATKNDALFIIIILIIWSILINAWACRTFANAIHRLGSKMIWFIPLLTLTGLIIKIKES